jgi:hypothetical protein
MLLLRGTDPITARLLMFCGRQNASYALQMLSIGTVDGNSGTFTVGCSVSFQSGTTTLYR